MTKKQQLGQFFTNNTEYILSGLGCFVKNKNITDPFAGAGDLLIWAKRHGALSIKGFDIDTSLVDDNVIFYNDSLRNPQEYEFVLTNPPYLYQNKLSDKGLLLHSRHTDLYQLALERVLNSSEGIVIVPINFLSAENSKYIRQMFLDRFEIVKLNYFTEQVFADTTYNVVAFYYRKKEHNANCMNISMTIFPDGLHKNITIYKDYNWQIGGDFLNTIKVFSNKLHISRLEEDDLISGNIPANLAYHHVKHKKQFYVNSETYNKIKNNIILLKAIDTGTREGQICLEDIRQYGLDALVSIKSSRNQISLIFPNHVSISEQEALISLFNSELNEKRSEYASLFMTNYRDNGRKRISFNFAYNFINYLYFNKLKGGSSGTKTQPALF